MQIIGSGDRNEMDRGALARDTADSALCQADAFADCSVDPFFDPISPAIFKRHESVRAHMNIQTLDQLMVTLPAAQFSLRDDRKKCHWTSDIAEFQLCRFPATQALYLEVMQASPSYFEHASAPVECVSWFDALIFCNQLSSQLDLQPVYDIHSTDETAHWHRGRSGFRLPTDAEWEYACRAGDGPVQYGPLDEIAWYAENADERTHPVGLKAPNRFGLYDMLGNVWEWCWDQYDPEVYGSYRVFRGGGWSDSSRGCLASNRRRSHPTFHIEDLGFRLARSST